MLQEMLRITDDYAKEPELNRLMKQFIREKAADHSIWSEMTIASCLMFGGDESEALYRAAALTELIILTLDIVDDLQDRDKDDKSWMQCPEAFTLNAVLACMAVGIGELAQLQRHSRSDASLGIQVSRMLARSISGQQQDIGGRLETEEDYIRMVQEKSGSLIRLACFMGSSLAEDGGLGTESGFDELADCIGIIAQLENDLNDLIRFDLKNDLVQKKRTLPILYMLMHCDEEFPVLRQYYESALSRDYFLRHKAACLDFIDSCGCVEYTRVIQSLYLDRAESLWNGLPAVSPWKEAWKELTLGPFAGRLAMENQQASARIP